MLLRQKRHHTQNYKFNASICMFVFQLPRREVHRIYDKIYATIYGHCIGDAIGLLTEGLNKEEVKKVPPFFLLAHLSHDIVTR